tara:strand:+ start:28 stop:528 length:501 start_codon:yes stop_codon:yes gene_type:complete
MIVRLLLILSILWFSALSLPVKSQDTSDYLADYLIEIQNQLIAEGFEIESIGRTWLGRILINATNGSIVRKIVVNRGSGQIIHDRRKEGLSHMERSKKYSKPVNGSSKNNLGSSKDKKGTENNNGFRTDAKGDVNENKSPRVKDGPKKAWGNKKHNKHTSGSRESK